MVRVGKRHSGARLGLTPWQHFARIIAAMAQAIARYAQVPAIPHEWLRMAIVCGCALALILAGQPLPY